MREVLASDDAWAAYRCANELSARFTDTSPGGSFDLPHAGEVLRAWAELADLYETGKTPIGDAHATLRSLATRWLARPDVPVVGFIERWVLDAADAANALFERDGDFWRSPQ